MPASTTQSTVDQAQRGKQRSLAPLYTTLLLELEMKSSGTCSVYSVRRTVAAAVRSDVNISFAAKCRPSRFQLCYQDMGTSSDPRRTNRHHQPMVIRYLRR